MRYFKNLLFIALFATILTWISSCRKEISPVKDFDPTESVATLIRNEGEIVPAKFICIQFNQFPDIADTSASFKVNVLGKFTDDVTGTLLNAGNIIINGSVAINPGYDNLYKYQFEKDLLHVAKTSLGNFVDLEVKGSNSVDSIRRKVYVPKPIFLPGFYKNVPSISNNKSYNLVWNPDHQNMFGKVLIQVNNYLYSTAGNSPGNTSPAHGLSYTVSDNGSFVIPASDLKRFPASSYVIISISRATDNYWPTVRSRIEYIAVTSASSSPILIQSQ